MEISPDRQSSQGDDWLRSVCPKDTTRARRSLGGNLVAYDFAKPLTGDSSPPSVDFGGVFDFALWRDGVSACIRRQQARVLSSTSDLFSFGVADDEAVRRGKSVLQPYAIKSLLAGGDDLIEIGVYALFDRDRFAFSQIGQSISP